MTFQNKIKKILFLFFYILISGGFVYLFKPCYFISIILVLVPPSIINFFWLKKSRFKILIFSLAGAILFAPPIELMTRLVDAWDVASIFPRPFSYIPLENMLFAFLNIFWALCFYEYFIDHDKSKRISKNFKKLIALYILFAAIVYSLFFYQKNLIGTHYWLMSVPILIVPCLLIFIRHPKLLKKIIIPTIFFALVFLIYEIISMSLGHWWWPGSYLYTFNINGMVFPLDDVIIWYFLSTPTLIAGYEIFADDGR